MEQQIENIVGSNAYYDGSRVFAWLANLCGLSVDLKPTADLRSDPEIADKTIDCLGLGISPEVDPTVQICAGCAERAARLPDARPALQHRVPVKLEVVTDSSDSLSIGSENGEGGEGFESDSSTADNGEQRGEKRKVTARSLPWIGSDHEVTKETEDDRAVVLLDYQRKGKRPVIKTTTRQTYFLLVIGLVVPEKLKPGDESEEGLVRRISSWTLPAEYDALVKAMEVDERPTEHYSDIGGLDKQIQELIEAVVLPMTHKDMFKILGIHPPKGVLHAFGWCL
ncbi:26S protease regulatory subunit 6a [Culex quinquefasciatus]|uniref:26S protease regulatory subunit 6a n=1 Tax=Culex quinquefasciatus TaxID=7176 RepID=B0WJM1_CULQU|nr:26S protease regulatory subunit 6a [Culex quinquefasciatus]|eukprot:XP_001848906.1 26S protease regulatory subunit 6a [Culex quinquefasciatus]